MRKTSSMNCKMMSLAILRETLGEKQVLPNQNNSRLPPLSWRHRSDRLGQPVRSVLDRSDRYSNRTYGSDQRRPEKFKSEGPKTNRGEDCNRHKGRKLKLSFDEFLAKYLKENEAKRANRLNDVKSSRLSPKPKSRSWNWQKKNLHAAASYSPLGPSMPISQAPHPTILDRYSSRGWDDPWAHTPSYFRPYYVEYAAPREPSHAGQLHNVNDHFKIKKLV